jgi:hypothetical protein
VQQVQIEAVGAEAAQAALAPEGVGEDGSELAAALEAAS